MQEFSAIFAGKKEILQPLVQEIGVHSKSSYVSENSLKDESNFFAAPQCTWSKDMRNSADF
jgi:hypothetical protein